MDDINKNQAQGQVPPVPAQDLNQTQSVTDILQPVGQAAPSVVPSEPTVSVPGISDPSASSLQQSLGQAGQALPVQQGGEDKVLAALTRIEEKLQQIAAKVGV